CYSIQAKEKAPKPQNRFSITSGIGLSYSIWNKVLDFEAPADQNTGLMNFQRKKPLGFNLFGEFNIMLRRNFYVSMGMDYNRFGRSFTYGDIPQNPFQPDVKFDYDGKIVDRYISTQLTFNKKIAIKKHSIHLGAGILFSFITTPSITLIYNYNPYPSFIEISDLKVTEFGLPFQLAYEYAINNKFSIGIKSQFQYLLSVFSAEHIYFTPYLRYTIQKRVKNDEN
ncbi:MAG: hypothetical protein KC414_14770, partial [Romboutsia sp.]|nr:hypothetical protein [Romboutsia sp.]